MKTTRCGVAAGLRFAVILGCMILGYIISGTQVASAQTFGFQVGTFTTSNVCKNSSTPPPACQVLTVGSPSLPTIATGGVLRLTTANTNQHGAAWFIAPQPLSTGFTTAFQFQISSTNSCFFCQFPADGMAIVIQNDPAGTGAIGYTGNGQNLSYGNNDVSTANGPGNAILNSLAIELDTHQNTNYSDPDGNHIAVQSCGPNNSTTLTPNSADHDYVCPNGSLAKLALQSLPAVLSLTDGKPHTITVNYLPPGTCTSGCNNLSVYMDSTPILQTTVDITKQLNLTSNGSAYIGFTAATGSLVENNDLLSWSFSSLPLAPITINQPLQTTQTNFNYTPTLTAVSDYSQSGLNSNSFQGVFMQGTAQAITDQQYSDLVNNTPFQGTTCQHQDTGQGNYSCATTTDLCTTPTSNIASGANCPNTGTNALIIVSNSYNLDPSQKSILTAPGYIMGKDTALSCGSSGDNTCKGLVNIFTSLTGDLLSSGGKTNNFNSILIPIFGVVQPTTAATTSPALNQGWTNGGVTLNFNSADIVPSSNQNPPNPLPTVSNISYSATGANLPSPPTGVLTGTTGSILVPGTVEGTTTVTFFATDSAGTVENLLSNDGTNISTASPTITIKVDKTPPTFNCTPPAPVWSATDISVPCTAADNAGGSGLATPSPFSVSTSVPTATETNAAQTLPGSVADVAGNTVTVPAYGPFWVDKKAPAISGPTISPSSPTYGQSVTANYSCTDGGSGVVLCGPTGSSNIPPTANTGPLTSPTDSTVGTHTFTVNAQDAVGNASTPASITYTVAQATPTVTFTGAPASAAFGSTFTVSTTTNASTTAVITAAGACSIAGNLVTMTSGTGTCSLTATWAADTNYLAATATQSTGATQIAPTVTFTGAPASAGYLSTFSVVATTNASTTAVITAAGSCSITGNLVKMISGSGLCSLTAAWAADSNYLAATASQSTSAVQIAPTVTFTGAPATAGYLSTFNVAATTNASTTAVIGATGACSVNGNTVTMSSGTGTCSLTATWAADSNFLAASASQSTSAAKINPTVTFTGAPTTAAYLATFTVATTTNASTTATITASGSCTITGNLVKMTTGTGICSLTATWLADNNYLGATASQSTNAAQIAPTVTFTGAPANAVFGSSFTVSATTNASTTATIVGSVACSASGSLVTMTSGTGTCSLTATWAADSNYLAASASQSTTATKAASVITWPTPAPITYGTPLSATQLDATANVPGLFVYSPPAGTVLAAGNQTLSVTFTPTDSVDYSSATKQVTLVVTQPSLTVSPTSINFGSVSQGKTATQTVTLSNPGTASVSITRISITLGWGTDSDDFTFVSKCGSSLAAGASCNITVTFNADDSGTRTATLNITDNAPGSPQTVALTGTVSKKGHGD